jgi:hypothetical protein
MIYYLTHIHDIIGNNYLGINIPTGIIDPYLTELQEIESKYEEFTSLQRQRDHDKYHITVINVMDYNKLYKEIGSEFPKELESKILKYPIDDLKFMGIGSAEKNGNRAYFVVCKSEKLDAVRKRFNLPECDFHITLGFLHKDVFGVRKNEVIKKKSKFLQLLRNEFYKHDNWDFIKKIKNFDLNKESEIIPMSISENSAKLKIDKDYIVVSEIDNHLWITSQYTVDNSEQRLPETEISKILK